MNCSLAVITTEKREKCGQARYFRRLPDQDIPEASHKGWKADICREGQAGRNSCGGDPSGCIEEKHQ
eukprot:12411318-Karenia_brevis.AAC.1